MLPPRLLLAMLLLPVATAGARTLTAGTRGVDQIQPVLNRARAGDTVRLQAGVYAITDTLRPGRGTRLLGAGPGETIIRYRGERPIIMLSLLNVFDVEVGQLALDGEENPAVQRLLFAYHCRHLYLHHLRLSNTAPTCGAPAIHFTGDARTRDNAVTDSVVSDCVLENLGVRSGWGCGLRFSWGSSRNSALRNTVRDTGRGGILADNGSNNLLIAGNTVRGSGGEGLGIEVWGGCDRCVIEDNRIDHWLSVGGSDWCAVRRNSISDDAEGAKFIGLEGIGSYCVYTDNTVEDGQMIGLSVSGAQRKDYCYYGHNTFARALEWAAQLQGERGGIGYHYFYRCRFDGTTVERGRLPYPGAEGHGLRVNGDLHHSVFERCSMAGNARAGVQLLGSGLEFLSFVGCRIVGNGGPALSGRGDSVEWLDCQVSGNADNALPASASFPTPPPEAALEAPEHLPVGQQGEFRCVSPAVEEPGAVVLWDLGAGAPRRGDHLRLAYTREGEYAISMILWDSNGRAVRKEATLIVGR